MSCACDDPEVWRPAYGFDAYEVSSRGRVRNARTLHVLAVQVCGKDGEYRKVHLGRQTQRMVHRLVAEAFLAGVPHGAADHVDHRDFDTAHNCLGNLRWLSPVLNIGRQVRYGPRGWERVGDEEAPEDYVPMTDAELAAADEQLAAAGWS